MTVCILGIDSVSLTLAAHYTLHGVPTTVADPDPEVTRSLEADCLPEPIDDDLYWGFRHARKAGLKIAPSIEQGASECQVLVLTTPLNYREGRVEDTAQIEAATEMGAGIRAGSLVIVETTMGVGDTVNRIGATVAEASGMEPGAGFSLAHCAPQCTPGSVIQDLSRAPRVFGGVDARSRELAAEFFGAVANTILSPVRNCETAELTHLFQLCSRSVATALADELASFGADHDVDPQELVANATAQTIFPVMGPRVGHSRGEVLLAMTLLARDESQVFVRAALARHREIVTRASQRLAEALDGLEDRRVLILHSTPGADVCVLDIAATLRRDGADVTVAAMPLAGDTRNLCDAVLCLDPMPRVSDLARLRGCRVFLDGTGRASRYQIERLGMRFLAVVPFESGPDQQY